MTDYSFATLNYTEDGEGWKVTEGRHELLVDTLNSLIVKHGEPKRRDLVQNEKADVLHLAWLGGAQIRYVMHKLPGYTVIFCPACRSHMLPPEWGGKSCHGWEPTWEQDPITGMFVCNQLTKKGEN